MTYSLVKDIADIIDSLHKTPSYEDTGHPMVRVVDVKYGALNLSNTKKVNEAVYSEFSRRYTPEIDDIVITRVGSYGISALVKNTHFCLGQNTAAIKPKIDKHYFFYALNSPALQQEIEYSTVGSTQKTLSLKAIGNLKIPRFDERAEKKIGKILSVLDDKIENNRRMNETLEEMARTIFKSWFVDFDPVHAKAAGNAPAHIDAETAALFPSSFGDDGLPEGWKWRKLGDCVTLTKGRSYKSAELQESDTALVSLKSFLRGGGYRPDGLKAYIGTYKDEQTLNSGDLIVALTDVTQAADVIGKPAIVRSDNEFKTLVASLDVGVLRSIEPSVSIPFLYCLMMTHDFQAHIYGHTSGTTVLHLGKEGVPTYEFGMPTCEVLDKFTTIAKPIFSKIELNAGNSNTLAELRDTLLPKLMSGEIRVSDAEREVEAAI